ncbi:hypothetical protein HOC35_06300 [Candidatus Woesearchaeota archaeon]|jgi:hypothetical protein|nr:hypothetical protein [Candidatus Woesearchaeota archaeon]
MGTPKPVQETKDHKTQVLEALMQYNGDRFVYKHESTADKKQGYHLKEENESLTIDDVQAGIRIPIKDIGTLTIILSSEERLEIDFHAKAGYFWLRKNLDQVEDKLYAHNARAVYSIENIESTHITYTDVRKLRQDFDTAMNLDLATLSIDELKKNSETAMQNYLASPEGALIHQYADFVKDVLRGTGFISPSIGPYRLHKLPDKKKEIITK